KWAFNPVGGHPMDHRFRHSDGDGDVLLVAAGTQTSGKASIYRKGHWTRPLWSANIREYPHAIERAQGTGVVVVAARGYGAGPGGNAGKAPGGKLYVFRPTSRYSKDLVFASKIPFHQAHGLLWDPQTEWMWAIGDQWLRAY